MSNTNQRKGKPQVVMGLLTMSLWLSPTLYAEEAQIESLLAEELTEKQDYLSGDVQELIELQTQEGVIVKLEEMEASMVEATLKLLDGETGGDTLAIQTEIIEKAYEAAQEKQNSQSSKSETDKALMDMLKKMMGESESDSQPQKGKPKQEGKNSGSGRQGNGNPSWAENNEGRSSTQSIGSRRTVPSAAPTTGELLPSEFQEMIDEYNR